MQSRKPILQKIEVTRVEGCAVLAVAPDQLPPYFKRRWAELSHEAIGTFEAWCPCCDNGLLFLRDAQSRALRNETASSVKCWMFCYDCEAWTLLEDAEILGMRVLSSEECEVARIMEE